MDDFATALEQAKEGEVEALLGRDDSLVDGYVAICEQEIRKLQYRDLTGHSDDLKQWQLEKSTWMLVKGLLGARLSDTSTVDVDLEVSDRSIANSYLASDPTVREYVAVVKWLEKSAPPMDPVENRKSLRAFTQREAEAALNRGARSEFAQELDPDGPLRTGKAYHPQDAAFHSQFFKTLFEFLRRGHLEKAVSYCESCNENWRAATLLGGILYHDSNASGKPSSVSGGLNSSSTFLGNRNRGAWMHCIYFIANEPSLNLHERALYASLCGNTDNVLPVCETWEDMVWAHFHSLIIYKTELKLLKYPRIVGDDFDDFCVADSQDMDPKVIFSTISRLPNDFIKTEQQVLFRKVQISLICNTLPALIADLSETLENSRSSALNVRHLRFLVHLILLLRATGMLTKADLGNEIITGYVDRLVKNENYDLVILYSSRVSYELQIDLMVTMLVDIDWPQRERTKLLQRAHQAGMDVMEITRRTFRQVFSATPTPHYLSAFSFTANPQISAEDEKLISSFQWLLMERDQFLEAFLRGNTLFRHFLIVGSINVVLRLAEVIRKCHPIYGSEDFCASIRANHSSKYSNMLREMAFIDAFVQAIEILRQWQQKLERRPRQGADDESISQSSITDLSVWKSEMRSLSKSAEDRLMKLLEGSLPYSWMEDSIAYPSDLPEEYSSSDRLNQLSIIRSGYIPFLISQLYRVLYETRDLIPGNLERALNVANLVAKSDNNYVEKYEIPDRCPPFDPRNTARIGELLDMMLDGYKALHSNPVGVHK